MGQPDQATLQWWANAYKQWMPFAEPWETHGLPVDLIGVEMEEKGLLDYSG